MFSGIDLFLNVSFIVIVCMGSVIDEILDFLDLIVMTIRFRRLFSTSSTYNILHINRLHFSF